MATAGPGKPIPVEIQLKIIEHMVTPTHNSTDDNALVKIFDLKAAAALCLSSYHLCDEVMKLARAFLNVDEGKARATMVGKEKVGRKKVRGKKAGGTMLRSEPKHKPAGCPARGVDCPHQLKGGNDFVELLLQCPEALKVEGMDREKAFALHVKVLRICQSTQICMTGEKPCRDVRRDYDMEKMKATMRVKQAAKAAAAVKEEEAENGEESTKGGEAVKGKNMSKKRKQCS